MTGQERESAMPTSGAAGAMLSATAGQSGSETGGSTRSEIPPAGGSGGAASVASGGAGQAGTGATAGSPPPQPAQGAEVVPEPTDDEAAYVFDDTTLRSYNILIAPADLARIDMQPSAEQWVPATLEFEGASYGPFRVRYKGSLGSFKFPCTTNAKDDPKQGKCSIKLGFDEVDPDLRFHGLKKLNFHAMNQDASMLHDRLGYSLFRQSGVAASRAVHARVSINGTPEGLFVAVEQVDGRFTRARWAEGGEGNIYKDAWVTRDTADDYRDSLESNTDASTSVQRMLDFQRAVNTSADAAVRFIDREYMMRYVVVDRVIMNDDGVFHFYCDIDSPTYLGSSHNFYWYEARDTARMWLIPWDLDLAFDESRWVHVEPAWNATAPCTCTRWMEYGTQTPPSCDPFIKHLISWRADYDREVDRLITGPFSEARVEEKLRMWIDQIRPAVREYAGLKRAPTEAAWNTGLAEFRAKLASARMNRGYRY